MILAIISSFLTSPLPMLLDALIFFVLMRQIRSHQPAIAGEVTARNGAGALLSPENLKVPQA